MPNIIDSIQISSSTFDVRDKSATTVVNLTQDEYDNLPSSAKTANVLYNITDASPIDISQYWTSAQTNSAINQAVSGKANSNDVYLKTETSGVTQLNTAFENKQDTLVSGFNIKTINNESILGGGNIDIQGGGIDSGTVQTMIDESISGKTNQSDFVSHSGNTSIHVTTAQTAAWDAKSDFSGSYNDLTDKPTIPIVPTNVSSFNNDAGYITSNDISGKTNQSDFTAHTANTTVHVTSAEKATWNAKSDFSGNYNDLSNKPTIPTSASQLTNDSGYITSSALDGYATEAYVTAATNDMATKTWVGQQGYLTQHQDISGKQDVSGMTAYTTTATTNTLSGTVTAHTANTTIHVTAQDKTNWNNKSDFSGDYNDLTNKPTIPSKTSDLTNDSGFATTGDVQTATADMATKTWVGQQGYLTQHQDISGKQDVSGMTAYTETSAFTAHTADTTIHVTSTEKSTWNAKSDFSGSYNDLTDKPTIPTVPTSNTAFTNDAGYITIDAISGKVDTTTFNTYSGNVETALSGKQDTLSAGTGIDITDNVISATGGGSTYTAGRGIKIDTANTISLVPVVYSSTGASSLVVNSSTNKAAEKAFAEGSGTKANGLYSHAEGLSTTATGQQSHVEGYNTIAKNNSEHASGSWNVSSTGSTTADKTLFSVGNGTADNARHNAFEIRQNGDIYITLDGQDVKLQDHLGGGSSYTAGSGIDITNDVISVTGKVDTTTFNTYSGNVETALSGKQDTLVSGTNIKTINNESILGSGNIDIQGGGKAVTAGTNISITTGETADTINCTLPIKTNAWNSLTFNTSRNPSQVLYASAFGDYTTASGKGSFAIGKDTTASGEYSFVGGYNSSQAKGDKSFSFGDGTVTNGNASVAFGQNVTTNNSCEFSCGKLNKSVTASTTFGDSGNTLFSVGNGTTNYHNAFEIRQNGDIYLTKDGQDVKLQDQLGGGGSSYTAGDGIDITNDVISVTGKVDTTTYNTYTAATDTALASKQTTLTAGTGISIVDNVISAEGGSITIDPTLDSGSTNAVANSAITTAINDRATKNQAVGGYNFGETNNKPWLRFKNVSDDYIGSEIYYPIINGKQILTNNGFYAGNNYNFQLVETSAITTSVTSSSTDAQVPSAKAVNDKLGGLSIVKLTQAQYDALATKDSNTLYVING